MTASEQLTLDDAAGPEQAKIGLLDVARDIYREVCRDMRIDLKDPARLSELAMRKLGKPGFGQHRGRTHVEVTADWLMFEILYGCDFLQDPDAARDPYSDNSWLYLLALLGAIFLIEDSELEWTEEPAS